MLASNPLRNSRSETIVGVTRVSPLLPLLMAIGSRLAKRKVPEPAQPSGFHSHTHSRGIVSQCLTKRKARIRDNLSTGLDPLGLQPEGTFYPQILP
jgi:hypothetical protein